MAVKSIKKNLPVSVRFDRAMEYVDSTLQRASDYKVYDIQPGTYPLVYTKTGVNGYVEVDPQRATHVHAQLDAILREEHWTDLLLTREKGTTRKGMSRASVVHLSAYPFELNRSRRTRETWHGGALVFADEQAS